MVMKKLFLTISLVLLFSGLFGQNLVTNPGLEEWTDDTTPVGFAKAENITKTDVMVHTGTYAAMHTSDESTKDLQQDVAGIAAGTEYTISYWYYDNDVEVRSRIWAYWLDAEGNYLDDNADVLRPDTYSENVDEWMQWSASLIAPPTATQFRFEVRVYKEETIFGGSVYYDDFSITGSGILAEPTNYPTNFAAVAAGLQINLNWVDAIGEQLPSAYFIVASSDENTMFVPVDGTAMADDTDLGDGFGALNIAFGAESAGFTNLISGVEYHFAIYPYTNGGENIDYKNNGIVPEASAIASNIEVLSFTDFNDLTWGDWHAHSVLGDLGWVLSESYGVENSPCASATGYAGGNEENEDWLISKAFNSNTYENMSIKFFTAQNYSGPALELYVSTNYDGTSDPNGFTWTMLDFTPSAGSWEWTSSGIVSLGAYSADEMYLAFKFMSTDDESATWELDNITVFDEQAINTFIAGSFNTWDPANPVYQMTMNANGVAVLTKTLSAGTHEYKLVNEGSWYPTDQQIIDLTVATDVTWRANTSDNFITHTNPVLVGNFLELMGLGSNWTPTNMNGEMTDSDGDDIYEIQFATIPAGSWEYKVTLNNNWNQNTSGTQSFNSDGTTPIIFYYDMSNNDMSTAPGVPLALVTFNVTDNDANPIEDATITINGSSLSTNASGNATIDLADGDYPYTIVADGYYQTNGSVTISGVDINEDVTLVPIEDPHFSPIWSGNPLNPMSITITKAELDNLALQPGDEIGVFDGDYCVGAEVLQESIDVNTPNTYVYIACAQDDPDTPEIDGFTVGNTISYRVYDLSEEFESASISVVYPYAPQYDFTEFIINETNIVQLNALSSITQTIDLSSGWNLVSWNISPEDMNIQNMLQSLIDENHLVKVIDQNGDILQHMPWGWVNNIGDMANPEGYQIKVSSDCQLSNEGPAVELPLTIPLISGFNLIGWPAQSAEDAETAFADIISSNQLLKVIDENGNILQHMPWGWVNNIGNLLSGEGYQVKVSSGCNLVVNEPSSGGKALKADTPQAILFQPQSIGNPYNPMAFAIQLNNNLPNGAELAVFEGDRCLGAAVVSGEYLYLSAGMDEAETTEIEGFTEGGDFSFRYRTAEMSQSEMLSIAYLEGDKTFAERGTFVGELKEATGNNEYGLNELRLFQNQPNPFHEYSQIGFDLPENGNVKLEIIGLSGKTIRVLHEGELNAGRHNKEINAANWPAGMYYCRLSFIHGNEVQIKVKRILIY